MDMDKVIGEGRICRPNKDLFYIKGSLHKREGQIQLNLERAKEMGKLQPSHDQLQKELELLRKKVQTEQDQYSQGQCSFLGRLIECYVKLTSQYEGRGVQRDQLGKHWYRLVVGTD